MMWPASKHARRVKLAKRKQKVAGWEVLGLGPSAKEQPCAPIDEIRRQAIVLAGRGIGTGARPSGSNAPVAKASRGADPVRRSRPAASR